jgi:hypothetical protein
MAGARENLPILAGRKHPRIQVMRWSAADLGVMAGVDEIRAAFEWLHVKAALL